MNRLQKWPGQHKVAQETGVDFGAPRPAVAPAVFVPLHYERNYAYPLLVWLHGPGDDERQLQRIMPLLSVRNYVAVGPRGTRSGGSGAVRQPGFGWRQSRADVAAAEARALEAVDLARARFNIHPGRIFVGGFQCGGTMALRLGLLRPDLFAGVVSMSGPLPSGDMPFGRLNLARKLPLLLTYGRDSATYGVAQVSRDLHLLHTAGMAVNVRQYPAADEMLTNMLADANAWLMERVTGVPAVESHVPCLADVDWN